MTSGSSGKCNLMTKYTKKRKSSRSIKSVKCYNIKRAFPAIFKGKQLFEHNYSPRGDTMDADNRGNPFNYTQPLATSDQSVDLNSSLESIQSSRLSIVDERIRSEPDGFIELCKRVM